MQNSECAKLAARYEDKRAEGLLDVKFFLHTTDKVLSEEVCIEPMVRMCRSCLTTATATIKYTLEITILKAR